MSVDEPIEREPTEPKPQDQGPSGSGRDGGPSNEIDRRMAELLASGMSVGSVRKTLQAEGSSDSDDILSRLNALDYLDSLVGEIASDLPDRLGEHRITGVLGRGGMGTVFEAFQESLERTVALKVLSPGMTSDPNMRRRFRTEARASATLHHQHVVPVYGFGEAGGFLYFTMERVDGVSLDKRIRNARHTGSPAMEPRDAARRFAGVADALAHAHRRGILHRDVKPGNILVHPDGSLALADFGLSKMLGEHSLSVSRAGGFLGTLHYAAPEQARGQAVTGASDLYGLGVTLYETLTNQLPVSGETTEAMLQAVLTQTPKPLRTHLPRAPKDLEAVLRKLLAKDPEDRYQDGEALARDLMRVAEDEPVQIRRRSLWRTVWRRARKHPALTSAVVVAGVLLLVTFFLLWQNLEEQRRGRITRHQNLLTLAMSTVEGESGPAAGPEGVLEVLTGVPVPSAPPGDALAYLDDAEAAMPDPHTDELRAAYLGDPSERASAALRRGHGHTARGLYDASIVATGSRREAPTSDSEAWLRRYRLGRLRLYRLHLGRAIASLTSSVADAEAARRDLLRAEFVRPGAFLPELLSTFLDWTPDDGVAALLSGLDRLVESGPPGADRAAGSLLLAFAGLERPASAHLMGFQMPHAHRQTLHRRGLELVGEAWRSADEPTTTLEGAIEIQLDEVGRQAVERLGDRLAVRAAVAPGYQLLDSIVAPSAPLQSWQLVYTMLENPTGRPQLERDGALSVEYRLRGFSRLLDLLDTSGAPGADALVQRLGGVVEDTLREFPGVADRPVARRLVARVVARTGDPSDAMSAAQAWIETEPDCPDAYLCRFRTALRVGDPDRAATDAYSAMQFALDAGAVRAQVVAALDRARSEARDPELEAHWTRLRRAFAVAG